MITKKGNLLLINDHGLVGGGAERRIQLLIKELIKRKFFREIHILQHEIAETLASDVPFHTCSTKNSGIITKNIIQQHAIDLVQVHHLAAISTRPIIAAKQLHKSVIFFAHDYWPICGRRSFYSKWDFLCKKAYFPKCVTCIGLKPYLNIVRNKKHLNLCDLGIAPSQFCIDRYENHKVLKGKWIKVMPWIDTTLFNTKGLETIKQEKNIILYVGPLTKVKGAYLLAEALKFIQKEISSVILRYVGSGQEKESQDRMQIEQILTTDDTLKQVEFLGKKSPAELKYEYARATVFVCCPLLAEMFGQTWAQALACGTPVIATNVGSIPELLQNRGTVVDPDPKILSQAIIKCLKNPQPLVEETIFSMEPMIKIYEKKILPLLMNNKA